MFGSYLDSLQWAKMTKNAPKTVFNHHFRKTATLSTKNPEDGVAKIDGKMDDILFGKTFILRCQFVCKIQYRTIEL